MAKKMSTQQAKQPTKQPTKQPAKQTVKQIERLPVLISIPHGGDGVPDELSDRICINSQDIFADIDPFTPEIYDIDPWAEEVITTDIARTFIDLNRAEDDLPPQNPDGIIKSMTCYKKPIYKQGKEPDPALRQQLVQHYYLPYHQRLNEILSEGKVRLGLDCHSMAASAPPISPDAGSGTTRPLICLGNAYNKASDRGLVEKLAACFCEAFSLEEDQVAINRPFSGGYITRTYGSSPVPWVLIDMNRALYLSSPWFNEMTGQIDNLRLMELSDMFLNALKLFFR